MVNKKIIFGYILALSAIFSHVEAQEAKVSISGRLIGLGNQEVHILDANHQVIGTTGSKQDSFAITLPLNIEDQRFYVLHVPALGNLGPSIKRPAIYFLTGSKGVEIHAKVVDGSLTQEQISKSEPMQLFNDTYNSLHSTELLKKATAGYNKAFHAYNNEAKTPENLAMLKAEGKKIDSIYSLQKIEIMSLVKKNPNSMTYAMLATQYCPPRSTKEELTAFLGQFGKASLTKSYYLLKMQNDLHRFNQIEVGQQAPVFKAIQLDGQEASLAAFRGKYVLLDFWASWCGPCRKEMPHVKAAYEEFKDKNFTVFALSIDKDRTAWEKALKEDAMPFTHAIDRKGEGNVNNLYMVTAIPTNFLIDPSGKIIAKNLRGEKLRAFLQTIL